MSRRRLRLRSCARVLTDRGSFCHLVDLEPIRTYDDSFALPQSKHLARTLFLRGSPKVFPRRSGWELGNVELARLLLSDWHRLRAVVGDGDDVWTGDRSPGCGIRAAP